MPGPDDRSLRVAERVIDLGEEGRFLTAVAAPADEIDSVISQFRIALTLTFVLLGAALMLSSLLQARFALAPLSRLHRAIADIRRGDAEHIEGEYPPDVRPVSTELNLLIDANREILERARTQVGNLAHALKTPLSVMVNEADTSAGQLSRQGARAGWHHARPGRTIISTALAPPPLLARWAASPTWNR